MNCSSDVGHEAIVSRRAGWRGRPAALQGKEPDGARFFAGSPRRRWSALRVVGRSDKGRDAEPALTTSARSEPALRLDRRRTKRRLAAPPRSLEWSTPSPTLVLPWQRKRNLASKIINELTGYGRQPKGAPTATMPCPQVSRGVGPDDAIPAPKIQMECVCERSGEGRTSVRHTPRPQQRCPIG
jgi:hypothetical protein